VPFRGRSIVLDVSDLTGWHLLILRRFDREVSETILQFASGDDVDVFWDIGANEGAISYEIAHALPKSRIVAVEPQPELSAQTGANLRKFGVKSVSLAVAVGETNSEAVLYVPAGNTGAASLTENWGNRPWARSMSVPVRTAQWIVDQTGFGWPTLVKIDVEGSEVTVFRSLLPAFQSGRVRCCVFEASPVEADFAQILAMTAPFGYGAFAIRRSPFSTWLERATTLREHVWDYALVKGKD
jgi:FkbM family methyltransferase